MNYEVNRRIWLLAMAVSLLWMGGCAEDLEAPQATIETQPETVNVGQTVRLDGGASQDPQDLPLQFHWQLRDLPAGSQAEFNDPTLIRPSFVADVPGEYTAQLVVANSLLASEPAEVTITVGECGSAAPVIAEVSADTAQPNTGQTVQLGATVSDADNAEECALGQDLDFRWRLVSLPPGSQATLNDPAATNPSLTPNVPGDYVVELVVTDSTGRASDAVSLTITASACGNAAPEAGALASNPSDPGIGLPVQLTATPTDADNQGECALQQSLSYRWTLVELPVGSTATLNQRDALTPSFTPDAAGDYVFEFEVTDSTGRSSQPTSLTVTATECGAASPETGTMSADPAAPNTGQVVTLRAAATDADNAPGCDRGQTLTHHWSVAQRPTGSTARLDDPALISPTFVPDVAGDYQIRLVVTDSTGRQSERSELTVTASPCGTNAPTITDVQANPSAPNAGQLVVLTAAAADADNQGSCALGQSFDWRWSLLATPAGSTARINGPTLASPTIVPDAPGDYIVQVVATDSTGRQSQPSQITITAGDCGSRRPSASLEEIFPEAAGPSDDVTGPNIPVGQDVQVSGISSSDPDNTGPCAANQDLRYQWSFASLPLDSNASFNNAAVINPTFTADEAGTYVLELRVTDSTGLVSHPARFTITATPLFGVNTATGFTATTVVTGRALNDPAGVTGDGSGNLYVAQRGGDSILQIRPSGAVSTFASGGNLDTPEDITYDPNSGNFFVVNANSEIIKIDATGQQTFCADYGGRDLRQIFYYQGTSGARLITASRNDDTVYFLDPSDCSMQTANDFNGNLDQPYGVTAGIINGQDQVFVSNDSNSVYRNTDGAYSFNAGNTQRLTDQRNEPRGLALTPCTTPNILVADQAAERIVAVDNCSGGNCNETVLATGLDRPVGLFFESSTSVVVTDRNNRTIFRLTGDFCSL